MDLIYLVIGGIIAVILFLQSIVVGIAKLKNTKQINKNMNALKDISKAKDYAKKEVNTRPDGAAINELRNKWQK